MELSQQEVLTFQMGHPVCDISLFRRVQLVPRDSGNLRPPGHPPGQLLHRLLRRRELHVEGERRRRGGQPSPPRRESLPQSQSTE